MELPEGMPLKIVPSQRTVRERVPGLRGAVQ